LAAAACVSFLAGAVQVSTDCDTNVSGIQTRWCCFHVRQLILRSRAAI
jgi:hypothetical protein